ncbi:MAG: PIG-L family deacetylase [Acidimicrobiia bacterium]|nr:PIG-L family deacetylase [Acidimicrobiia bacterium]
MRHARFDGPTRGPGPLTVPELGRILSIWAHPDDETYLAGGVMAEAVRAGPGVVCVSATAGEHGTDDPVLWPPGRLAQTRRWEAEAAMAVLGVRDHRWLGYEDGTLGGLDPAEPVRRLVGILEETAPDTILTFGPDGATFHPDHIAVSGWVFDAWQRCGRRGRLLHAAVTDAHLDRWAERYEEWGVYMSDDRPTGVREDQLAVHLRLEGEALDQKVAALAAMRTQTAGAITLLGADEFAALNAAECFVEVVG